MKRIVTLTCAASVAAGALVGTAPRALSADTCGPAKLVVLEAAEQGVAVGNQQAPDVQLTLTLYNASTVAACNLTVYIGELRDEALQPHKPLIDGSQAQPAPFTLPPHQPRIFSITSTLPDVGTYRTRLLVTGLAEPLNIPISVTRASREKTDIAALRATAVPVSPFGGGGEFKQNLIIRRSGGTAAPLTLALTQLEYAPDDKIKFVVPSAKLISPAKPVDIAGDGTAEIPIALSIPHAGIFEAKFEHQLGNQAPATSAVTLYAREPRWVAIVFILLGILIATVLRRILTVLKPQALGAQRMAACRERIQHAATTPEADAIAHEVIKHLRVYLTQQWERFLRAPSASADTVLEESERKVQLFETWLHVRAGLAQDLPDAVRNSAVVALQGVQRVLENENASAADVQQQFDVLSKLPGETNKLARESAAATIKEFAAQLATDPAPQAAEFRTQLQSLAASFEQADEKRLPGLFVELDAQRLSYVRWQAETLRARLQDDSPVDMDGTQWLRIKKEVEPLLDGVTNATDQAVASERYLAAVRELTYPLVIQLMTILSERIAANGKHKTQYESLHQRAVALRDRIATKQLLDALSSTDQLINDFNDVEHASLSLLDTSVHAAFTQRPDPQQQPLHSGISSFPNIPSFGWFSVTGIPSAADASRRAERLSLVAALLAIAITVLLGVHTLWSSEWTWGGTNAYLLAILWGAGVYGFSFEGLHGLINRIKL